MLACGQVFGDMNLSAVQRIVDVPLSLVFAATTRTRIDRSPEPGAKVLNS